MTWARLGCLLALAACTRSPPSTARSHDATEAPPIATAAPDAAPTAKDPPVDTHAHETQVTLTSTSSPTATVGALTVTLLGLKEIAAPSDGKVGRFHQAKLRLQIGADHRDVFVTDETTALGYTIRLHSAGDAQADPHAPREAIVVIAIRPAS